MDVKEEKFLVWFVDEEGNHEGVLKGCWFCRKRGLSNVTVITCDINTFNIDKTFDRILSIEMFEVSHLSSCVSGWHFGSWQENQNLLNLNTVLFTSEYFLLHWCSTWRTTRSFLGIFPLGWSLMASCSYTFLHTAVLHTILRYVHLPCEVPLSPYCWQSPPGTF
jgi:hypothetical protein